MNKLCVLVLLFGAALAFPSRDVCVVPTDPPTTSSPSTTTIDPEDLLCGVDNTIDCDLSGAGLPLKTLTSGTYYFSTSDKRNWCDAFIFCQENNMILAHAYDKTILQNLESYSPSAFHFWLGASDLVSGEVANLQWTNGDVVNPALWQYAFHVTTNCGVLCSPSALHSFQCTDKLGYVCQVPTYCT